MSSVLETTQTLGRPMIATAPTSSTRRGHDETVRMRPVEPKTVRMRFAEMPTKSLPKAISAFDGKTVRMRALDVPVVGKVANTVRQRYADLSKLEVRKPSKWEIARLVLVLVLASMPILAISVEVFGLASQSAITMVTIALVAVLATLITFAPHRIDMMVGR